ncbi:ABC transporter permease [Mycolicibacterium tokaiense]|uniref:Binding-protein-dependent transport system inner membrane protein n=1 Tax=Mycolicibacterium tokaiense TaxID=39695 RepID=A0A378TD24_9MYCO|nr:ABC transporter permease [Mycolicibacterium tokaiense]STZ58540.1 binding-protein-dependent transport system inner membrane protein [Mycolicibacterium tokaiense]
MTAALPRKHIRSPRGRVVRLLRGALTSRRGMIGAVLTLIVVAITFLGPLVAGGSPTVPTTIPFAPPGNGNGLLGGDQLGRDVLTRVLHGGIRLLLLAMAATALAVIVGALAGVVAAYRGGTIDTAIMRGVDVLLGIPQLVLALLLLSMLGPQDWLVILAVAVTQAPQVARVMHAAAQNVCEQDYVKAVANWGVPPRTVIRRHVMPSLVTPLTVETGLRLSYSIVMIAGLSFIGLGAPPPDPDWGVMINENRLAMAANPWGVLAPAILLALLAVGVNTFADAVARTSLGGARSADPTLTLAVAEGADADSHPGVSP